MPQSRPVIYHIATSADGFIARHDGSFDFFLMDGDHVADYVETLRSYGAVVMGRATYELGLKAGVADPYPFLDTYVITKTLQESPHPHVTISAHAAETVRALKRREGAPVYLCGGAALARELFAHGLIDQLVLKQNPVLLGGGMPLTSALAAHIPLTLLDVKRYQSGVVLLTYDVQTSP